MQTILNLFRLQIDEKVDLFKSKTLKKISFSLLKYLLTLSIATAVLTLLFFWFSLLGLSINSYFFAVLILISTAISFALGLGTIFKTLYHNKDNDLLMSLPCSHNQVFISKLMVLYVYELIANTLYTLPIFIAYGIIAQVAIPSFYIFMPLFLLILPLLPLSIAAVVSVPLMGILNFLKKNNPLMIISTIVFSAVLFGLYMMLIMSIASSLNFSGQQSSILIHVNDFIQNLATFSWIFEVIGDSILFGAGWYWKLPIFLGLLAALSALSIIIVKYFYFKLAMKNSETSIKTVAKPKKDKCDPPFVSLFKTEMRSIFRSSGNMFSYFLFTILMPFIVFAYDKLLLSVTVNQTGMAMISASHVLVLSILAMLSNLVSSSAVSREGGNFYLTKITPTSFKTQAYAKIAFNCIFTVGALLITSIVTLLFTNLNVTHVFFSTFAVIIAAIGHIFLSYIIDLRKPTLDWYDSSEIEKISKNTKISMLIGLILSVVMFSIAMAFAPTQHIFWPWIVMFVFVSVFTVSSIIFTVSHINKYFNKVEV